MPKLPRVNWMEFDWIFLRTIHDESGAENMKAWAIRSYGKNEKLELMDFPQPSIGDEDVFIRIHAASLNPVDFKIRDGELKLVIPQKFPLILGNDCAGVVMKVGSAVKKFQVGDEVYCRPHKETIGTLAEFIAARESTIALKPKNISFEEAASIPLVGLTSWQALFDHCGMKKGSRVFIPAGSGGVGSFAIQLANYFGAWVATNTSTKNIEFVRSLGADQVIDYTKEDFSKVLRDIDIVYDTMGYETQKKAFSILKPGGQLISIVGPPTGTFMRQAGLPFPLQLAGYLLSIPSVMRAKAHGACYKFLFMLPNGEQLAKITPLIEAGHIRPNVDKAYAFSQANEAMAHIESGRARGKVVVKVL